MSLSKKEEIENRVDVYAETLQEAIAKDWKRSGFTHANRPEVEVRKGRKYAKVFAGSSIHTFVNLTNGDILKAASYKAPAPNGVRGSVLDQDYGMSCVGPYGALYINGPNVGFK